MMKIYFSIILGIILGSHATFTNAEQYGVVNFNVSGSPVTPINPQSGQAITMYGCNTKVETTLSWDANNQVVGFVPYGKQISTSMSQHYHVSKYYLASPPMPLPRDHEEITNLGLLTPDRFVFEGKKPAQIVSLDYQVIKPLYLRYVSVDYDHGHAKGKSCKDMGVGTIVINTSCLDLPWRNGALGGSGIGVINNTESQRKIFIPTLNANGTSPSQCRVTLLDDINPTHEVFFLSGKEWKKEVDLTAAYNNEQDLRLICVPRKADDLPKGCQ